MKRHCLILTSTFSSVFFLAVTFVWSQTSVTPGLTSSGQPELYFVPDVVSQFNQLALRPEALAFSLGNSPDPDIHKHYQGIVRKHGPGTPYLFMSRSGNDVPECVTDCAPEPGNLVIVKMGSRDANGERLRSNRLRRDWPIAATSPTGQINTWPSPPDSRDTVVAFISFDGNGWPSYGHPGGMQIVGDVLVVPLTVPYPDIPFPFPSPEPTPDPSKPKDLILFLDVSTPEAPVKKSQFVPATGDQFQAGQVALTPVINPLGPGLRYVMLVAGKDNRDIRLYRSLSTTFMDQDGDLVLDQNGPTDLKSPFLNWELLRSWSDEQLQADFCSQAPNCDVATCVMFGPDPPDPFPSDPDCRQVHKWPNSGSQAHQMFNFVRQGSLNGPLFLIATRNDEALLLPGGGHDFMDLYRVEIDSHGSPGNRLLTHIESKHVSTDSIGGGGDTSHFAGSTGVYVSPTGELIVYASQHNNEGPPELLADGDQGRHTVRFGEWRHREMVRPGSPTLRPTVELLGPFEVDEGTAVTLSAVGRSAITKAWVQLFEDDGVGLTDDFDGNAWLVSDYEDWDKDDFDDFTELLWFFNDEAGSWRWFAPVGCTIRVNEHSFDDGNFPGDRTRTLFGKGRVKEKPDLDDVLNDLGTGSMDNKISSVQFFPIGADNFPDCRDYYNAPINVAWDFNQDGTFETSGNNPSFSAVELDGPSVNLVPVRAQHPTDPTELGVSSPSSVNVRIRNVPPNISTFALVDSLGFKIGVDVPFALVNLEYAAEGSFTDPGKPDHQTATLDLDDGPIISSNEFDLFTDAFGGVVGHVREGHTYSSPGNYTIRLEVTDDDAGRATASSSFDVFSPTEALLWVVDQIKALESATTNTRIKSALTDARFKLNGNPKGSPRNGAIQELANGDLVAALVKIAAAITALESAEGLGAGNLSNLKYILGLVGESVAQGAFLQAVAAVGAPSPGEAAQLLRIRQDITEGHTQLLNGAFVAAINLFKDATGRAVSLL